MNYASTFLSHSHADKPLVELVAHELWQRGVVAWLDKNDLAAAMGADLSRALREAVRRQASVTIFLSDAAINAAWVNDELAAALQQEDKDILPVFIGDPLQSVRAHDDLKRRWLHPDGRRIKVNYEQVDPNLPLATEAARIAEKIALRLYDKLQFSQSREVIICLDQRGKGSKRADDFPVPDHQKQMDAPALVFRANNLPRTYTETLRDAELTQFLQNVEWALSHALATSRGSARKVYLSGEAQLALPFAVGKHFDRSNNAYLFCYNSKDGEVFCNDGQSLTQPLTGGNAHCEKQHPHIQPIAPGEQFVEAALIVAKELYLPDALGWLQAHQLPHRHIWVESEQFKDSQQAMRFVADVVALLTRLKIEHGMNQVLLFIDLPFGVAPLLAANLLHVAGSFTLMEFRKDFSAGGSAADQKYFPVLLP